MYPNKPLPNLALNIILSLFLALACANTAFSDPGQRANAEALTHSMVGLSKAYQKAAPAAKSAALQKLIDATVERQALLAELIKTDPGAVLRTAIPAHIRKGMPAEVQAFVEQRLKLEGELEVMYEDYADGSHRLRHMLKGNGERISLHFKSDSRGLLSATRVSVSGVLIGEAMAVESGEDGVLMLALDGSADGITSSGTATPVPNTFGEQRTLVILVNFQNNPVEPYTPEFAHDVIIGQTSDFFMENSFGQTWLSGDVTDWFTIPMDSTVCNNLTIKDYAEQAASSAGYDLANYDRLVYAFPQNSCVWWGTATVGGEPSRAYFNGELELALTGHELGHNLGLSHGHSLVCDDGSVLGSGSAVPGNQPWPNCSNLEYGDGLDIMGWSPSGHFSAYQKERLGWLGFGSSPVIRRVDTGGRFEISPYASSDDGNPKALKILKAEDAWGYKTWYYLEYRQAVGYDAYIDSNLSGLVTSNVLNGITVHVQYEGNGGNSLFLLDMTPETNIDPYTRDPALVAGLEFQDPGGHTAIKTDWTDPDGAMVSVTFAQPDCIASNPTLVLSPSVNQWVTAGTPVIYTATLTNQDSSLCPATTFDLSTGIPSGWSASLSDSILTLAPGTHDMFTLTVTSATNASDGFYDVNVSATSNSDAAFTASGTTTYVIDTPITNQLPVAINDSAETPQDTAVVLDVLANDSDPDGDPLTLDSVTQGAYGMVTMNPDNTLVYTPENGFAGTDNFTYSVSDGNGGSAIANVTITVVEQVVVSNPPVATDDEVAILEKAPVTFHILGNDSDPDGGTLTVISVTQGSKGTVRINADGTLTYTPAKRFKDVDNFTYTISNGAAIATARVNITLQGSGGGKGRKPK